MRIDWYTKGILTVIALLPGAIVARDYVGPVGVEAQSGGFAGIVLTSSGASNPTFFDPRTGELWAYSQGELSSKYRLMKPGAPLVKEK